MAGTPERTYADPATERLLTGATVITFLRTFVTIALCLWGAVDESLPLLVAGLVVYWVGDSLDGEWARWFDCETRIGAVVDMMCDRLSCACFYLGFLWQLPDGTETLQMAGPVGIYLFEFMVIDLFLSLAFLAWPIRSPNYFHVIDRRIYLWNWSRLGKAANSGLFAILLLVTGWWWLGMVIAVALLALKCVSLRWLLQLGLPVPAAPTASSAPPGLPAP